MSSTLNTTLNTTATGVSTLARQVLAAAAVGAVLLYGVAFAHSPVAHNAAHDVRHVTVKPCH